MKFLFKNLIACFLALFMCVLIVGCAENKGLQNDNTNGSVSNGKDVLSNDELLNDSDLFSGDIAIDGKIITFPCKLDDLKKNFTIKESSSGEQSKTIILVDENGCEIKVWGYFNEKSEAEMYFHEICVSSENLNISFPKGLKIGMQRSEVEEIFKDYKNTIDSYKDYSNYAEIELSEDLLGHPFTSSYSIGSKYSISYDSDDFVEDITYTAKPHIEDDIYYYSKSESSEGSLYFQLPLALGMDGDHAVYRFAIYNHEGKNYIMYYRRDDSPLSLGAFDTTEKGTIEEITKHVNDSEWTSKTTPTIQHNTDLVRSAVAFGDSVDFFEKSQVAIGESKTVEYPVHRAVVICGFGNTFLTDRYEIFSADFAEIPQAVIEKFESIVNEAAKNLTY